MTIALSQIVDTSLPELPGTNTLQVDTSGDPAVLLYDLGADQPHLHCRLLLNMGLMTSGELAIAGGIDSSGAHTWQLVLDVTNHTILLQVADIVCGAELNSPLLWHTIEVNVDTTAGLATLRVNGTERDTASITTSATRFAWVGGAFYDQGAAGSLRIDDWILADAPIGVPLVNPEYDHAGDPRRWLVIYNRSDTDSVEWAEAYRQRRGIPLGHLCGLHLSNDEISTAAEYESLRQQVNDYLDDNFLRDQIIGVLLGLNVPGYVDMDGQGGLTPIASYLHSDDTHGAAIVNPLYQSTIDARPVASDIAGVRLTGRIDAPSLADALAMMDRADNLTEDPLRHDGNADVLVDINPDNPNIGPVHTQPVADWANGQGLNQLRLPATVYDAQAPTQVENESVVWGWRDAAPPSGFFSNSAGRRAICIQFAPESVPAVTLRDASATDWLSSAIQAGYAFAAAPSRAYSLSTLPLPHLFFEGLRLGWTVAEAWLVAQPFIRDGLQIVGDPLATIPFPKAGYDVFGPFERLDQIDLTSPLSIHHAGEHAYQPDASELPVPGERLRYLVRRIDGQGRADLASASAYLAVESGKPLRPALPAWPADEDWPVYQRDGQLYLQAFWASSLTTLGVDSVRLYSQSGSDDPVVLGEVTPATGQRSVVFVIDRPVVTTRYQVSIGQGSATFVTPWSQDVTPASPPNSSLTLLEPSS